MANITNTAQQAVELRHKDQEHQAGETAIARKGTVHFEAD
jgi:hypothetical protein